MAGHFLLLYPKNPAWAPENTTGLVNALKAIGLLGAERGEGVHDSGPEYLGLVTYLGCSPQVVLGGNEAATAIRITGILDAPQFVHGTNLKSPRCPQCRKTLDKPALVPGAEDILRCSRCGHTGNAGEFDWRRSAACARLYVEISNVFESEAVPGEHLAECLEKATGEAWDYCYVCRDDS